MTKTIYRREELEQQLAESRREFRAADATIHNIELNLTEMAAQLANAESKCRELAAEGGVLKKAAEFATAPDMWIEQADGMLDYRYFEWYVDVLKAAMETPATDAFLAEVRAQGVERMIEVKQQQLDGMHPDTFAIGAVRDSIRRDIYELKVFAEILRQETAQ